ncbi:ABC transporter ATP-binding protein [Aureimonas populi]|uniref:ABC transporter ATP-binding protein n=1 Tax=Aureimonas populi TaxID=1701758 RepID=A0ABW5CU35_9HYPH|nr:sn-glycerol-3-phosphate ABC transporter ATP-binding protein UgpC [Aureimonas populi]
MAHVQLRKVSKAYEGAETSTITDLDLHVGSEEFVVLVGPSGCGKSTTLRMVAGLEDPTGGEIWIGERRVDRLDPRERNIAMVFQNYALYPHMTVAENMSFGLRLARVPKAEIRARVEEAARILDIGALLDRRPKALSGGQRQRVAMGRAIVRDPAVFLFDEPLSNLDAKLRGQMRAEIRRLQNRLRATTIYVTHDQVEAMTLADRVVVMNGGVIEQEGPPQELYARPRTRFVAGFLGSPTMNFLPGRVEAQGGEPRLRLADDLTLPLPPALANRCGERREVEIGLRPEHFLPAAGAEADLAVPVEMVEALGATALVHFTLAGQPCTAALPPDDARPAGSRQPLRIARERMILFDRISGLAL